MGLEVQILWDFMLNPKRFKVQNLQRIFLLINSDQIYSCSKIYMINCVHKKSIIIITSKLKIQLIFLMCVYNFKSSLIASSIRHGNIQCNVVQQFYFFFIFKSHFIDFCCSSSKNCSDVKNFKGEIVDSKKICNECHLLANIFMLTLI